MRMNNADLLGALSKRRLRQSAIAKTVWAKLWQRISDMGRGGWYANKTV